MSFTFQITRPAPVGVISIGVRNPAFGDNYREARRQATGETEGGRLFIQDLGSERYFYEATFESLTATERRHLEYFFGPKGTNKRSRRFLMGVANNTGKIQLGIGTGQGLGTADGLTSGQLYCPPSASFGEVRLEQSEVQFTATPRHRYTVSLRFRLLSPIVC